MSGSSISIVALASSRCCQRLLLQRRNNLRLASSLSSLSSSLTNETIINNTSRNTIPIDNKAWYSSTSFHMETDSKKDDKGMIRGWIDERSAKQEKEKYMKQMQRLADMDGLTVSKYKTELEQGLNLWTNIKFLQTKQIKDIKRIIETMDTIINVLGPDATYDDLDSMDRITKLQIANDSNKTVEEVMQLVSQYRNMDIMQRWIRNRKHVENKSIPADPSKIQMLMQHEAKNVMTKTQTKSMKRKQKDAFKRMSRKIR